MWAAVGKTEPSWTTGQGLALRWESAWWEVVANHETWNMVPVMISGVGTKNTQDRVWRGDGPAGRSLTTGLRILGAVQDLNVNSTHCPWSCRVTHS